MGFYIRNCIDFKVRTDLNKILTIEICKMISTWCRPPKPSIDLFNKLESILQLIDIEKRILLYKI